MKWKWKGSAAQLLPHSSSFSSMRKVLGIWMMMSILLMNGMSTVSADLVKPSSLVRKVSPVSNDMTRHDKEQGRRLVADSLFQENEKGAADPVILMSDEAHGREAAELTGSEPFEHKIGSLRGGISTTELAKNDEEDSTETSHPRRAGRRLSDTLFMYGSTDGTGTVKSWAEAEGFCETKMMVLASHADYCNDAEVFSGVKQGDQWSPISDYPNGWVEVGIATHPICATHRERAAGSDPAWGADATTKQPYEANYVLCKKPDTLMFSPTDTADIKSYYDAEAFCYSKGMVLGSSFDYCTGAQPLFTGGAKSGDQWAPIGDYPNGWIQIGNGGPHHVCVTHRERADGGDPAWGDDGTTKIASEANYVLCKKRPKKIMFAPPHTAQVKSYTEAEAFCYTKGMILGSSFDYCTGNQVSTGGAKPEDQWAPIADYPNGWIQIGNGGPHPVCVTHRERADGGDPAWGDDGTTKIASEANYVICKEMPEKIMFAPVHTAVIKDYAGAKTFCRNKGMILASHADYCNDAEVFSGVKQGDQWSPISDYPNGWVEVGIATHPICATHRERAGGSDPAWGADATTKQPYEANYVLCKKPDTLMFSPTDTAHIKNYYDAQTFCYSKGMVLGSSLDYCTGTQPLFTGGAKSGDQWAPIGDYPNGWIQVGVGVHPVCSTHRERTGADPGWGADTTKQTYAANYVLCKKMPKEAFFAAPTRVVGPRPPTSQPAFSQCQSKQQGIFVDEADSTMGCIDAIGTTFDILEDFIELLAGQNDEIVYAIEEAILKPVEGIVQFLADKAGFTLRACLGDFSAEVITDSDKAEEEDVYMVELCHELPLSSENDAEWSVFAFHIGLPNIIAAQLCEGLATSLTISACFAVSACDVFPSIAYVVDSGLFSCLTAQAGAESSGIATGAAYAMEIGMNYYSWGFSLTNAFEIALPLFNGKELLNYAAKPTITDSISLSLESGKIHSSLEDMFEFSGTLTRGLIVNSATPGAPPADERTTKDAVAGFDARETGQNGEKGDITNEFDEWTIQALVKGQLKLTMLLSNIPVVGDFLQDFEIDLLQANAFISTGTQEIVVAEKPEPETVHAGIYLFMGHSGHAGTIRGFIESVFGSLNGILGLLPGSWEVNTSAILASLDLEEIKPEDISGVGITLNEMGYGFLINVPLELPGMDNIMLQCTSDYMSQFNCSVRIGSKTAKFFKSLKEAVKDGFLWIIRETNELFDTLGDIISVGYKQAGVVLKQIFSWENVKATVLALIASDYGKLSDILINDLKAFLSIATVALGLCETDTCWENGTTCLQDVLGLGVSTCCNCCSSATYWDGAIAWQCGTEKCWENGEECLEGTTCIACCSKHSWWWTKGISGVGMTACGLEPSTIEDGEECTLGECNQCKSGTSEHWFSRGWTACGLEPHDWPDGKTCTGGTSCDRCKSGHHEYWPSKVYHACGKEPCWGDGTVCGAGGTCNTCCDNAKYSEHWYSKGFNACGHEPHDWPDGKACTGGTSCDRCKSGRHEYWTSKLWHACGAETCWKPGTICGAGTTCNECCDNAKYSEHWYSKAFNACGHEPHDWPDGKACTGGTSCDRCKSGRHEYWPSKVYHACGAEPCWGPGTICGAGTTCNECCGQAYESCFIGICKCSPAG